MATKLIEHRGYEIRLSQDEGGLWIAFSGGRRLTEFNYSYEFTERAAIKEIDFILDVNPNHTPSYQGTLKPLKSALPDQTP